ncbi:MAG TPA: hypothetical protein VFQ63_01665 [Patescibacteria group bacterium]|nr:hypothetical protein [Patescibacteria group bacterium]
MIKHLKVLHHRWKSLPKVWNVLAILLVLIPFLTGATSLVQHAYFTKQMSHANSLPSLFKLTALPSATPTPEKKPTQAPTSYTQRTTQPTLTPTPTKAAQDTMPPVITSMTGPANGDTITSNSVCFPVVISDNVSQYPNLYIHTQFDSSNWTDWSNNVSPCFSNLSNGPHSFSVAAKDQAGNVSAPITRTFGVSVAQNITITVNGHSFADANCNGIRDAGENDITNGTTTASLFKQPENSLFVSGNTDSSGTFTLSGTILDTSSITVNVILVAPSGYGAPYSPKQVTLSKQNSSATVDVPFVPNADRGLCHF